MFDYFLLVKVSNFYKKSNY